MLQQVLIKEYEDVGIKIHRNSKPFSKVEKLDSGELRLHYKSDLGEGTMEVDTLIWAIGRSPETEHLGLKEIGVKTDKGTDCGGSISKFFCRRNLCSW